MRVFIVLAGCAYFSFARELERKRYGGEDALGSLLFATHPRAASLPQSAKTGRSAVPVGTHVRTSKPAMALGAVGQRIVKGASQGAVGAVVAAGLSAFTEPVVNRVLVNRVPVIQSIKELDVNKSKQFFKTTLPTNFLKFPLFEAVSAVMAAVDLPDSVKGAVTGIVFTSATLPVTNYRFCKSMDFPINTEALWKAYLPTVFRDILYGISRNKITTAMALSFPGLMSTGVGRALAMFPIVYGACILSSPGNELRGYFLQPKDKRKSFKDFFNPVNYARSTFVGALIMAISLVIGNLATMPLERLVAFLRAATA
jgi:hypothetical protein